MNSLREKHYIDLINMARKMESFEGIRHLRIAFLADCTSTQLNPFIELFLKEANLSCDFYHGNIGAIQQDVLNPDSDLYKFNPDVVFILNATQVIRNQFYVDSDISNSKLEEIENTWINIRKNSNCLIIQSNFAESSRRIFGNYELAVESNFSSQLKKINQSITKAAKELNDILVLDIQYQALMVGLDNWYDETLWSYSKNLCAMKYLPRVAASMSDMCISTFVGSTKAVVIDLDNTIWGGVIGDDGLEGIELSDEDEGLVFKEFQYYLLELKKRGILLAIASKNSFEVAIDVFRKHPHMVIKEKDISAFAINWENKVQNIKSIQKQLNIGFDSMVFLDDNKFEREMVKEYLPAVKVPNLPEDPACYIQEINKYNLFETNSYTKLDEERASLYENENKRIKESLNYTNVEDYLENLEMVVSSSEFNDSNIKRVVQLTSRSNQYNLLTKRLNQTECEEMANNCNYKTFGISLTDKFGDHGLICVLILKKINKELHIEQLLMSCRVLSRGLDSYVINLTFKTAKDLSCEKIIGKYIRTSKNKLVENFFEDFKFKEVLKTSDESSWEKELSGFKPKTHFIKN